MRRTLESVRRQTVQPSLWIVVDDGSTDETPAILAEYSRVISFLKIVRRNDRGYRKVGAGVIEAFDAGYRTVDVSGYEYLCKLDLDLELPERYFEVLIRRMEDNPRLGTCSGKAYYRGSAGQLISEGVGDEMSVGASKFYRVKCFLEIGGFVPAVMWDGIDCHRCRMHGWSAESVDDPELRFLHLRPMGSSQESLWKGRWRHGAGQWFMGTGPVYMTASALYRMTRRPFLLGGLAMWLGYVGAMVTRQPRYGDGVFRAFLHRFQLCALVLGKRRTVKLTESRRIMATQTLGH